MKKTALVFLLALSFLSLRATAQDLPVPFATGEFSPYTRSLPQPGGAAVEIVLAACKAGGMQAQLSFYPWVRAEEEVARGKAFASFPYGITPERQAAYDFSDPILYMRNVVVCYSKDAGEPKFPDFHRLEDLKGLTIGVVRGLFIIPRLEELGIAYEATTTLEQCVTKLRLGRLDAIIDDEGGIYDAVARLYPAETRNFRSLPVALDERKANCLLVSRSYPGAAAILGKFNEGLASITRSGELGRILEKYHLVR